MNSLDEPDTYFTAYPFLNPKHVEPSGWLYKIQEVEIVKDPGFLYLARIVVTPKGQLHNPEVHRLCEPKLLFKTEDELRLAYALEGKIVI